MRIGLKLFGVALVLAAVFLISFEWWGGWFEKLFNQKVCVKWFRDIHSIAWLIAVFLLLADLVLPVPATGIMAALGAVYGLFFGSIIGIFGSVLAGLSGYSLARFGGKYAVRFIADDEELEQCRKTFDCWGGWAVLLSRMLPVMPEVIALLAGIAKMDFRKFVASLFLGTVPTVVLFVCLGYYSREEPWWGMMVAILLPILIWSVFLRFGMDRRGGSEKTDTTL